MNIHVIHIYVFVLLILIFIIVCLIRKAIMQENKRKIWIYWDQGWAEAPLVCKYCLESWKLYNEPNWEIIQLDRNNIKDYIDMEERVPTFHQLPLAFKSDVLRINLLQKFNGVWVDATLFCTKPLDEWIKKYNDFFAFSSPSRDRIISSWFLYSKTTNYIVNSICKSVNSYIRNENKTMPENYFQFHYIVGDLYKTDHMFKTQFDAITPKISADIPHTLKYIGKRSFIPTHVKNNINEYKSPMYKLDHNKDSVVAIQSKVMNAYSYLVLKHNLVTKIYDENKYTKYLVVGSGPEVTNWISTHLQWFINNDYKIITFNNSWKTVPLHHIFEWCKPSDSQKYGTFIPSSFEKNQINKITEFHVNKLNFRHFYLNFGKKNVTTMLISVLFYLLTKNVHQFSVAVVGCNMIYKKDGDTFYSHLKISKAKNDPINKFSDEELANELLNIQQWYDALGCDVRNASTMTQTRLPFKKFIDYI